MDRADEHRAKLVENRSAELRLYLDPALNPRLELRRCAFGESEGDDGVWLAAIGEQGGHTLRHDLRLARACRRDDLEMAAAVLHGRTRVAFEAWCLVGSVAHARTH